MTTEKKQKPKKPRVNGSFMDIMKAPVKHADNHSVKKKH
jgi:hypothetical protein